MAATLATSGGVSSARHMGISDRPRVARNLPTLQSTRLFPRMNRKQ